MNSHEMRDERSKYIEILPYNSLNLIHLPSPHGWTGSQEWHVRPEKQGDESSFGRTNPLGMAVLYPLLWSKDPQGSVYQPVPVDGLHDLLQEENADFVLFAANGTSAMAHSQPKKEPFDYGQTLADYERIMGALSGQSDVRAIVPIPHEQMMTRSAAVLKSLDTLLEIKQIADYRTRQREDTPSP